MIIKTTITMRNTFIGCLIFFVNTLKVTGQVDIPENKKISKYISINAAKTFQQIDGFGVNITPAQWNNGKLKPVIDSLVDDLGATLIRFDCAGLANWLNPEKRNASGKYPEEYLREVYTNKVFSNAWSTFRYLNSKGIKPSFSVSGRIPKALGKSGDTLHLSDFDGYAEMVVTMLDWARRKEHLDFSLLAPFNETDLGFPEGPKINAEDVLPAIKSIIKKLDEYGLSDVKLIVMDDCNVHLEKLQPILQEESLKNRIAVFGTHTYGNGGDAESVLSYDEETSHAKMVKAIKNSSYKDVPCWLTEYGDLDLTHEIEFEFSWRSCRRLIKILNDGFSGAEAWDAFDNFHEHDTTWSSWGMLKTDTLRWTYTPRKRYYAAKQFYKFIPKGYRVVTIEEPSQKFDIYRPWRTPLKNLRLIAFLSPDHKDFTIVGMSSIEQDAELNINLKSLGLPEGKKVYYYKTSKFQNCQKSADLLVKNNTVRTTINERTIFTITTLKR